MTQDKRLEKLAEEIHSIYQKEAWRQNDVRHPEAYYMLSENIKQYDRVLADFILAREKKMLEEIEKPLMQAIVAYPNHECQGCRMFVRKITDDCLATINKYKGE